MEINLLLHFLKLIKILEENFTFILQNKKVHKHIKSTLVIFKLIK